MNSHKDGEKMKNLLLTLGVFMTSHASADDLAQKELLKISKEKFEIMANADIEALDKLLDPSFTLKHITGYISPRKEWLNDLKTKRFVYHKIQPENYDVKVSGTSGVVISKAVFDATIYGGRGRYNLKLVEDYKKVGDQWKLLKMDASTY